MEWHSTWFPITIAVIVSLCLSIQQRHEITLLKEQLQIKSVNTDESTSQRILEVKPKSIIRAEVTDDTKMIQRLINKARTGRSNGTVVLPRGNFVITKPLNIKGGVTLRGQGYGSSPLAIQFDAGGTTIAYCGTDYAIKFVGHAASLENLAVYDWNYEGPGGIDCAPLQAKGGVLVSADGKLIESLTMKDVLIYQFMGGAAVTLEAKNEAGIAFGRYENLRIRHAKYGVILKADALSFVNSNHFLDGVMSGEITEIGILATGPGACNENQFNGMAIEPPVTAQTHVYVSGSKTNIILNDVRLEGTRMPLDRPMIIIEDDSYGNVMNGMLGHTFVQADLNRNPEIKFSTNKMVGLQAESGHNLFWNAAFHNLVGADLPGWDLVGGNFQISSVPANEEEPLFQYHNIVQITYNNNGQTFKFKPSSLPKSPIHSFCSFGIYAKTNVSGSIVAAMKYASGSVISSRPHTGSGNWEFIGMSSLYDKTNGAQPYFSITGDVILTAPTFVYGSTSVSPGVELMSASGARMNGLLSLTTVDYTPPPDSDRWSLPLEGNVFNIQSYPDSGAGTCNTSHQYVSRINNPTATRFPKGTLITILVPTCGNCVKCLALRHSAYINLLKGSNFAPDPSNINSSITLMAKESGTWREVSRNIM